MFSACSVNESNLHPAGEHQILHEDHHWSTTKPIVFELTDPPTEDNQFQHESNILRLHYWDRPENARVTLFKQYAYLNHQVRDRSRLVKIKQWNLSRILSIKEIKSLSERKPNRIPLEQEYQYWLREAIMDLFKTLPFDEKDLMVLERAISFYI